MKINDSKIDKRFATFLETMQEGIEKYPDAFKFVDLETDIKIELKNIVDLLKSGPEYRAAFFSLCLTMIVRDKDFQNMVLSAALQFRHLTDTFALIDLMKENEDKNG